VPTIQRQARLLILGGGHGAKSAFVHPTNWPDMNRSANFSAANCAVKAARWKMLWPEITVLATEAE
jgi:hypothetical protein